MCFFHFKLVSIVNPKKLNSSTFSKSLRRDNSGISPLIQDCKLHNDPLITNLRVYVHNHLPLKYQSHKDPAVQFYPPPLVINYNGVYTLLSKLNVHKAMGPDQIPNILLKKTAIHTAELLTCIFNQSISSHSLPKDWLQANINPLFKKGNTNLAVYYRPVSLTCVC